MLLSNQARIVMPRVTRVNDGNPIMSVRKDRVHKARFLLIGFFGEPYK